MKKVRFIPSLVVLLMAMVIGCGAALAQEGEEPDTYYVNSATLNIRAQASASSKLVGKLYKFQEVRLWQEPKNGWVKGSFKLRNGDFVDGYVNVQYLKKLGNNPIPANKLMKEWALLTADPNLSGWMQISKDDDEYKAEYTIMLNLGGQREVYDQRSEEIYYGNGSIWHYPYDAKTGYLSFGGYLWYQE